LARRRDYNICYCNERHYKSQHYFRQKLAVTTTRTWIIGGSDSPKKRTEKPETLGIVCDFSARQKSATSVCFPLTNTLKQPMETRTGPNSQRQGHLKSKSEQNWAQRPKISKLLSLFGVPKAVTRLSIPLTSTLMQSIEAITARNHQGEVDLELVDGRRSKQVQNRSKNPSALQFLSNKKPPSYSKNVNENIFPG
jgi:hypothetical protein